MPTITIPAATYELLARHASELGTTIEAAALRAVEAFAPPPATSPADLSPEEWKKRFAEATARIHEITRHIPPGHFINDSRESIYEGCGE